MSVLAGILIGIGDIALLSADNKYIGAFLFSVALLSIIKLKLPLYTGRIGKVFVHRNIIECTYILFMNIIGVTLTTWIVMLTRGSDLIPKLDAVSASKFSKGYLTLFLMAVMCNILIHIAVTAKNDIITVLCVMVFIISGYEHSIADFMFALADGNFIKWAVIVLGNTVGGIATQYLLGAAGYED